MGQVFSEADARIEASVSARFAGVETAMAAESAAQNDRVGQQGKLHTETCTKLNSKVDETTTALESKFTAIFTQLNRLIGDRSAQLETRVDGEHKLFTDLCAKLDAKLNERASSLDQSLTRSYASLTQQLADTAAVHNTNLEKQGAAFREQLEDIDAKAVAALAEEHTYAAKLGSDLQASSRVLGQCIDNAMREADLALKTELDSLKQTLETESNTNISNLSHDVGAQMTRLRSLVEETIQAQIDAINVRVAQDMEPRLADTAQVAAQASKDVEVLKTTVHRGTLPFFKPL
jgi:hypothetical protein